MGRTHGRTFQLQKSDGRRRTKSGGQSDRVGSIGPAADFFGLKSDGL